MITIILCNKTKKQFNLKNSEREKALYNAWFSMSDDKKYENKRLRITTDTNETFDPKISEITDCKYENCTYFSRPEIGNIKDRNKKEKSKPYVMDQLADAQKKREEKNIKYFLGVLESRKVPYNLNDPTFLDILEKVRKVTDSNTWRLNLYANIYTNMKL